MTNEQIIFNERMELMNSGVIGKSGRKITVKDMDGNSKEIEEPEQMHTFMEWKKRGYAVKHGEKAISKFPIWKHTTRKAEKEGDADQEKMFMKVAFFFTASQVEPIETAE
ncbi:ArdC-like ssDNA-binding domain-containing protein [Butyrivibrio sp. INlla16]|uniref:ArdC-like ssDNA-binding domain-containing protein n=1 Tax=Butyrivibrio sp. INlla16 TaxID=1520807 RepID=UPI000882D5EF|nr:ArdC-like ssDNA-binding domain-containing protein [Butyrivibrio sp. INlla16]SDB68378.1 hypothetical protein SAMN02910263_04168 [Butyrivibrio sp. INlla16]